MDIARYVTKEQIEARIERCAKQRDHAADVLGKEMLAWTYQIEINALADKLDSLQASPDAGDAQ